MTKKGPDFYDTAGVFDTYSKHRSRADSPNANMEQPLLWNLIGDPKGLDILDLGCGDAAIAKKFKTTGANSYEGVEGSQRMFEASVKNIEVGFSKVSNHWLEDFQPTPKNYDLVISSLVFHYIADLPLLFEKVYRALRPGGRFIFSVEHPVITSCNLSLEKTAVREAWIVDDYFDRRPRNTVWMGDQVTKYHRTIEDFFDLLITAGFQLEKLKEAEPAKELFPDEMLWKRRSRIPLFLVLSAVKKTR